MYHNKAAFISAYLQKFQSLHGKGVDEGSTRERYEALAGLVRDLIAQKWARTNKQYLERGVKQVYYFSIEYLQGRILITNLLNLDLLETCTVYQTFTVPSCPGGSAAPAPPVSRATSRAAMAAALVQGASPSCPVQAQAARSWLRPAQRLAVSATSRGHQ